METEESEFDSGKAFFPSLQRQNQQWIPLSYHSIEIGIYFLGYKAAGA
jgi:hypothetical protein